MALNTLKTANGAIPRTASAHVSGSVACSSRAVEFSPAHSDRGFEITVWIPDQVGDDDLGWGAIPAKRSGRHPGQAKRDPGSIPFSNGNCRSSRKRPSIRSKAGSSSPGMTIEVGALYLHAKASP